MVTKVREHILACDSGSDSSLDFPEVTVDEAKSDMYKGYVYQKTSVDKSVIAFAEAHPDMKVVLRRYRSLLQHCKFSRV